MGWLVKGTAFQRGQGCQIKYRIVFYPRPTPPVKFESQIHSDNFFFLVYLIYSMRHTYTKKLLIVYLKFTFNWVSSLLFAKIWQYSAWGLRKLSTWTPYLN